MIDVSVCSIDEAFDDDSDQFLGLVPSADPRRLAVLRRDLAHFRTMAGAPATPEPERALWAALAAQMDAYLTPPPESAPQASLFAAEPP